MDDSSLSNEHLEHMLELLKTTDEVDVLKETCKWLINELIDQDVTDQIQAKKH